MKKQIIKGIVFAITFFVALIVTGKVINQGHNNMTMEMAKANLPILWMEYGGVRYNELHGYTKTMDVSTMRETVTMLGENRELSVRVDTYGRGVESMEMEVRSMDGKRLIENSPIPDIQTEKEYVRARFALKDLIDRNAEYSLTIRLHLDNDQTVYYYTIALWADTYFTDEKIAFVQDFHQRLYDREAARELTKYLETNSALQDNSSFHYVNIHSSFRQLAWGDLAVCEEGEPSLLLTDIGEQTASFLNRFTVSTGSGSSKTYYRVEEHYRIRRAPERIYLLNYERTMTQIPDVDRMYANDKILLGITGTDIAMRESEDGSNVVFEVDNQLYSYNSDTNKLTVIFRFYDKDHADMRSTYNAHGIKILDVTEGGNVDFAVYGYMNRGQHEGEMGIQVYSFNSARNTIEENVYIPYRKSYAALKEQVEKMLYQNRENKLYLMLENAVYEVDLAEKSYYPMVEIRQDDTVQVSDNSRILVWIQGEDVNHSRQLNVRNLNNGVTQTIRVGENEALRPLGFIGEDVIYGIAREADIYRENSGRIFFPMYKVCISDSDGNVLKEYCQDDIYVTSCSVQDNQITLDRLTRRPEGGYTEIAKDHIMNSTEADKGVFAIVAPGIDVYERYVQIQTRTAIDGKTIQILTPKEVVFEGGRDLVLEPQVVDEKYYVYGAYGVEGVYWSPARAVELANATAGVVINQNGNTVWRKGNRALRNQIMAITAASVTEEKSSLAVCLDSMLQYEGVIRNSDYLLAQGQTVMEILDENLEDVQILDLAGCELDAMLYYLNRDIPVLALLKDGEAVLLTGFNENNIVVMDPGNGTLAKKGIRDTTEWLKNNGNNFVTYMRQ